MPRMQADAFGPPGPSPSAARVIRARWGYWTDKHTRNGFTSEILALPPLRSQLRCRVRTESFRAPLILRVLNAPGNLHRSWCPGIGCRQTTNTCGEVFTPAPQAAIIADCAGMASSPGGLQGTAKWPAVGTVEIPNDLYRARRA